MNIFFNFITFHVILLTDKPTNIQTKTKT